MKRRTYLAALGGTLGLAGLYEVLDEDEKRSDVDSFDAHPPADSRPYTDTPTPTDTPEPTTEPGTEDPTKTPEETETYTPEETETDKPTETQAPSNGKDGCTGGIDATKLPRGFMGDVMSAGTDLKYSMLQYNKDQGHMFFEPYSEDVCIYEKGGEDYEFTFWSKTSNEGPYADIGKALENDKSQLVDELGYAFSYMIVETVDDLKKYRDHPQKSDEPCVTGIEYVIDGANGGKASATLGPSEIDRAAHIVDNNRFAQEIEKTYQLARNNMKIVR